MITLTGPGGVGKTRLAMQMAAEQVEHFVGGVYFVNLAVLDDAGAVIPAIAQTLGVAGAHGDAASDQLKAYLADRRMLVVIDNFEHVMDAAGALGDVARVAPRVRWVSPRGPLCASPMSASIPSRPWASRTTTGSTPCRRWDRCSCSSSGRGPSGRTSS